MRSYVKNQDVPTKFAKSRDAILRCDVILSERTKGAEKASCGETVVQKGVFGESVSSLPP